MSVSEGAPQAEGARDNVGDLPDVPAPKIGDAPTKRKWKTCDSSPVRKAYPFRPLSSGMAGATISSLAVAQIEEAVPSAFAGRRSLTIAARGWLSWLTLHKRRWTYSTRSETRTAGFRYRFRANAGISEEERRKAIETVHYAIYEAPEARDAVTTFDSATGQIKTVVVLESGVSGSAIEDLRAVAEAKLIEATRADILDSVSVVVVRSRLGALGGVDGSR